MPWRLRAPRVSVAICERRILLVAKRVTKGNLWGFIQSRPYASVADIRRLFFMDVEGAAPVPTSEGTCYIGLPPDTAELIAQLCREGRIGLDLNLNVKARVVQGVFPVRLPAHRSAAGGDGAAGADRKRRRRRRQRPGEDGVEMPGAGAPGVSDAVTAEAFVE
jgi:hypothetical protein